MNETREKTLISRRSVLGGMAAGTALAVVAAEPAVGARLRARRVGAQCTCGSGTLPADARATSADGYGLLDVKKLFGASGNGQDDDTASIIAAIDRVEADIAPLRHNGALSDVLAYQRTLYFPAGEYLVSDTLVYSFPYFNGGSGGASYSEGFSNLRIRGECAKHTTIRLKDHASGFDDPSAVRPVLMYGKAFWNDGSTKNNMVGSNFVEDITIDTGKGNPGAVALLYQSANNGAIRNVTLRGEGAIGLYCPINVTQVYVENLSVEGFDRGVHASATEASHLSFDRLRLSGYSTTGLYVTGSSVSAIDLEANGPGPAVELDDPAAVVSLVDSRLKRDTGGSDAGGSPDAPAILVGAGGLLTRDQHTQGFAAAVRVQGSHDVRGHHISQYCTDPILGVSAATGQSTMAVRKPRKMPRGQMGGWTSVKAYGAVGDGSTDDTAAIQEALNSARSVWFPPGSYMITETITIPDSVRRINFMYCQLNVSGDIPHDEYDPIPVSEERAVFSISGSASGPALFIDDLFAWPHRARFRLFSHDSPRTVVMEDLHSQSAGMYRSTDPKAQVYLNNVSNRTGKAAEGTVGFWFAPGASAWCRQINPEHGVTGIVNDSASVWILGVKTENAGRLLSCVNGGHTEILGGVAYNYGAPIPASRALVESEGSRMTATLASSYQKKSRSWWHTYAHSQSAAGSDVVIATDLPVRGPDWGTPGSQRRMMLYAV